jgi:hypothetical protein
MASSSFYSHTLKYVESTETYHFLSTCSSEIWSKRCRWQGPGKRYTVAALECLKYLHRDQDGNTPTTDSPIPKLFPWALQCLPTLLDHAVITDALVKSARRHEFSQRSKYFLDDESAAKLGSSRHLSPAI